MDILASRRLHWIVLHELSMMQPISVKYALGILYEAPMGHLHDILELIRNCRFFFDMRDCEGYASRISR